MTYQSTVRRVTLVAAILVAIASALFLVAPFGKGVPLAQASVENTPATGAPTIIGTAQVGETLRADTTGIADTDGLDNVSFSYQWLSSRDTPISGATGSTYTLVSADLGKIIKVKVTFTDDAGNWETLTSGATPAVEASTNSAGICDRTGQVRETILDQLPDTGDCAAVTDTDLSGITRLALSEKGITTLKSGDFSGLSNLRHLNLVDNELSALPDGIFDDLTGLQELSLFDNRISRLPDDIFDNLTGLQSLGLSGNGLSELPDGGFDNLTGLQSLGLSGNGLSELPDGGFDNLTGLQSLGLGDNSLNELPDGAFDNLTELQWLDLGSNDLSELPGGIFDNLTRLRTLKLSHNDLSELPDGIFDNLTELEILALHWNSLSELPDGILDKVTALSSLELSYNDLSELPDGFFDDLSELQFLHLSDNELSVLPDGAFDSLTKLWSLSVGGNELSGLPEDVFVNLAGLQSLDLNNNELSELPDGIFDGLSELHSLHLNGNELSELPDGIFDNLTQLRTLSVDYNELSELPDSVFDNLSELWGLSLVGNELSELPDGIFDNLANLKQLYLSSNKLSELPDRIFYGLASLDVLNIDENTGSPFIFTVELERPDENTIALKVAQATPFDMEVTLSAEGGSLSSATVTIPAGNVSSEQITVSPDGAEPVTISVVSAAFLLGEFQQARGIQTALGEHLTLGEDSDTDTPAIGAPTVSGTAQVGETLTADTSGITDADGLSNATFIYQWLGSRDTEIQGATSAAYTLVAEDEGKTIKVRVTFSDDGGNNETLTSAPTAVVSAALPPPPNNVRAVTQKDGPVELTWDAPQDATVTGYRIERRRAGEQGSGQQRSDGQSRDHHTLVEDTGSADTGYTDESAEQGVEYEYQVSARNEAGPGEASGWVRAGPASASNSPATGAPTIIGTAQVGETLTADTTGIADTDGLDNVSFSYQWLSSRDTPISGATGSTYTLVSADLGKIIKVKVTFTDDAGNDETLTSPATDAVAAATQPNIAITSDPDDDDSTFAFWYDEGVYGIGDEIEVTVTFNENVTVTGSPRLELTIGSSAKSAAYKSANGSKVVFGYTVAVGDNDTDGIAIGSNKLTLNGGSIRDAADNTVNLSHSALSAQSGHKVDGIRPRITRFRGFITSTDGRDGVYTVGESISAYVRFSEEVIGIEAWNDGSPRLRINMGGDTRYAGFFPLPPNDWRDEWLHFLYEVVKGDLDLDGISVDANSVELNGGTIRDAAGNDAVLTHSAVPADDYFIVDGVPPTVSSVTITSDPGDDDTYGVGDTIEVTVTFSEAVNIRRWRSNENGMTVTRMPRLELNIGGVAKSAKTHERERITGAAAIVFRYTVQDGDNDSNGISISANKLTLNGGTISDANGTWDLGGNPADLTHTAVDADSGHKVDTTAGPPESADAALYGLTLRGIRVLEHDYSSPYPGFRPAVVNYTATVHNIVTQTTVTATTRHSSASYVVKLGGVTDADGTVSLAVGSNVITVEVTAEDGETTQTYTVIVTRAELSTDATLRYVRLSGIDIGAGLGERAYAQAQASFSASVYNSISQTTVSPTVNHSGASYVIKLEGVLGSVTDVDGVIPLAVGSNVITIEVTAEDGQTTRTYTVTVNRATASAPTTGELSTDDPPVNFRTVSYTHEHVYLAYDNPRNRGITGHVAQRYKHDGDDFVSAGADGRYEILHNSDIGGYNSSWTFTEPEPDTLYKWVVQLVNSQNATVIETSLSVRTPPEPGSTPLSSDATLSDLTLSGIDFDATDFPFFDPPGFDGTVTSYVGSVANSVAETTVTATTRHSSATYAVNLGGVADADGTVSLAVGSNVITVEVTAEDGETTRTYTVTVTRVSSDASTDATLRGLVLSDVDYGTVGPNTTTYTAQVANDVSETLVTPYVSYQGASYVVKLGGVTDINRRISLAVGSNVITVEVTAEDLVTTKIYTITVTRAAVSAAAPDLVVSSVSIDSSTFGDPSFTLQATVRNQGSGTSGLTTLHYYRSVDSTITSGDAEVGTDSVDALAASGSSGESIDLVAPSAPGTYYYGACVDAVSNESDATNNCSSVTVRVNVAHPNSLATGAPTISGTAEVGETLTADTSGISDADGLTNVSYTYKWLVNNIPIHRATSSTYSLEGPLAGMTIKVRVSFTDDAGNAETLTSAATDPVAHLPNSPATGAPTISGTAQVGETLTADTSGIADEDGLDNAAFAYQWLADDTAIQGATGSTYTILEADNGKAIKVRVSFTDDADNGATLTSAETETVSSADQPQIANSAATGAPTISGTAQVGETLTADTSGIADENGLTNTTFSHQWLADDTAIQGATGSTYTILEADEGKAIKVQVSFTDDAGNNETLTSAATEPVTSAPAGPVFSDGLPGAPRNLNATAGNKEITLSWDPPADNGNAPATRYRIEWRVDGKDYDQNHWGTARSTTYTTNDQANLANGVKYFFRVKAENDDGNSYGPYGPASGEMSATPTSGSAVDLATPVLSDTETLHHGMVQLDWPDIEDAGWYVVQHYDVKGGEWLDLPAEGVDIAFQGSSAVVSNLHGLSWLQVRAMSCGGTSEWSQIEQLFGTKESDWEGVPVPEVEEGDEIEPCPVVLGTPVLSEPENLHHGMVRLDWPDIEDAGWYVVQYYHVKSGEWLDLPAAGVDIVFHGSSAVVSNLHGLSWLRVRAMSCAGESEWSQIEQLFGTNASDWEGVPVPEVAEGDEIEPCSEDVDTSENSPATGAPAISGTAQVGETLEVDTSGIADADGLDDVSFTYQWLADDVDISGATGSTYTLTDNEEGKAIKVEVSFTDDADNDETLTSAATDAVSAANIPATGAPTISGTARVGEVLTVDTSGISDEDGMENASFTFTWGASGYFRATGAVTEYTIQPDDEGKTVDVTASFIDDKGNQEFVDSAPTSVVEARPNNPATGAPTISGTAQVGETVTADTSGIADADGLTNAAFTYQWLADDAEIAGATGSTYTLADTDEGKAIKVEVSFTDDARNEETLSSAATDAVAAASTPNRPATGAPTISGTAQVGETLTANTSGIADEDGLDDVSFTYQWTGDGEDIAGATGATYTLAEADEGKAISVSISFTDDAGNEETLTSGATAAVASAEPSEPPDKPTGLSATTTHGQVVLTWDDPQDDSITGYVILRRVRVNDQGGEFSVLVADTGTAATTYTDNTVAASTTYTYRIKAINEHGVSERSRWYHIDTPAPPVPDQPKGLSATASHDSITLTWDDPGDDSITGYVILRRNRDTDAQGEFTELASDTGTDATSYTDGTVAEEARYTYRIKAINEHGVSERSRWYHISTPAAP